MLLSSFLYGAGLAFAAPGLPVDASGADRVTSVMAIGENAASIPPPDPAFPFTDLCDAWHIEYLVSGSQLSLWTKCPMLPGPEYISVMSLEASLVATDKKIKPAFPSNSAPQNFSTVCQDCQLAGKSTAFMMCSCSTNTQQKLSIDLSEYITSVRGLVCFTDGVVCGDVTATVPLPTATPVLM
ncbi:hypothetical protein SPI_07810 [Niveomyces insectorum RCEF 264]|uniref:Cyanovirin-N domain-containing protein n=1 Tax=Niveomyces insectorum RCEF 264 TaxID=1081102 RepID=A0A167P1W0_9HYPO|nr:hypothetical protein SPI_07810 [Niveomyces insectorum RCEF 264]